RRWSRSRPPSRRGCPCPRAARCPGASSRTAVRVRGPSTSRCTRTPCFRRTRCTDPPPWVTLHFGERPGSAACSRRARSASPAADVLNLPISVAYSEAVVFVPGAGEVQLELGRRLIPRPAPPADVKLRSVDQIPELSGGVQPRGVLVGDVLPVL